MTSANTISVLLVEDSLPDVRYVKEMLAPPSYIVVHKKTLCDAHELTEGASCDVVLLDLSLPDAHGIETLLDMLQHMPSIPIIVLTGLDDEDVAIEAVKLGAQDYILKKEINEYTLTRTIRYAIERKQKEADAQRLVVLEQHEEFMATLTHDLKNPLIGANRILELLAEQALGKVSIEQAKILLQLRDSNKLLLSMIQNLIEVYKFEKNAKAVCLENTNLYKIVTSCIDDIAPIAENREIEIVPELQDNIKDVLVDATAIRRVLQNLLDNALKFTPAGGKIRLTLKALNGTVIIEITDTGPGISQEEQKLLFQRFSQGQLGRKYTPGTGLGLFLCKQIVDAHQGKITCLSAEGTGTTFRIELKTAT